MFDSSAPHRGAHSGRVLGIDPGLTRCGYAVLDATSPTQVSHVSLGVLRTSAEEELSHRLAVIQREVEALLDDFSPETLAIEQVFFQSNVRTAMSVAQVSGIVIALAARRGVSVVHYTPSQVKAVVAGWGGADKSQVQRMVQARLGLSQPPSPADAADAAAIALCHLACAPLSWLTASVRGAS